MKKLAQMVDAKIQKTYDLYTVPAREFVAIVRGVYEKKDMDPWFVQRFNQDIKLDGWGKRLTESLTMVARINAGMQKNEPDGWRSLETYEKNISEAKTRFLNGELFVENVDTLGAMGYELMPFAISVPNRDLTEIASLELLDGFRRIFYMNDIPEQDILVKVYDTLSDAEWISAMVVFNSWKFADEKNELAFLDRGLKLGLYKRYGIDYTGLLYYGNNDSSHSLRCYVAKKPYETLWQNDQFAADIRFVEKMKCHLPVFTVKKKTGEQVFDASEKIYQVPYFLEAMQENVCRQLGRLRRLETERLLGGEQMTRKDMRFEDYLAFLEAKDLQKHFIKLSEMSVSGFIDNYIQKHLLERIKEMVDESLVNQK